MRLRFLLAAMAVLAACGGGADLADDVHNHADHIVIGGGDPGPPGDPGGDVPVDVRVEATPDDEGAGTELPADLQNDAFVELPGDLPAEVPEDVASDLPADEAAGPELPPQDIPHETGIGACAPGDPACWCTNDSHCNPSYSATCRPNTCDPATSHCRLDTAKLEGTACDDGETCTGPDTCHLGACAAGPWTCACKTDADCDDGNPCTSPDTCQAGKCVVGPKVCDCEADADCDDHNVCTSDTCNLSSHACVHGTVDGPCDDGNSCTGPDTCTGGVCVPGPKTCECQVAADCDDKNPCTDDGCASNVCQHANNTLACDDGDATTMGDRCAGGACVPGIKCGDGTCAKPNETCKTCPADCGTCPATETNCGDGFDDDQDGLTDCQDPDCAGKPPCIPDTCKKVDQDIACGASLSSEDCLGSRVSGKTNAGCDNDTMGGTQKVYRFVSPVTGQVRVRLYPFGSSDSYSLDILSGACNPVTCIAFDYGFYVDMKFQAVSGTTYYFVTTEDFVTDSYSFQVTCP